MSANSFDWTTIGYFLLFAFVAGLLVIAALCAYIIWRVRRINLPDGAGFMMALRAAPLSVVLLLDALDFTLDVFSAPFTWIILGRLGLAPLRGVAVIKDLIPFDNFIPAMTAAWLVVRLFDLGRPYLDPSTAPTEPQPLLPPPGYKQHQ
ncbi:MAG: hypothetical protein WCF84_00800 [Anaerolineae bacterium]